MISTSGRCNGGGCGRTMVISKECRTVNGGGGGVVDGSYVNHCDQVLVDQNEMVMAASMNAVVDIDDQMVVSINHRVYPPSTSELSSVKELALANMTLMEELMDGANQKISVLQTELDSVHQQLADANKRITKLMADREESLDALPFTPVSSTCSSGMGDLSSAELHEQQEQQEIKPKKRRIRQATIKQPNPRPLESNQTKRQKSSITRAKSSIEDKMQELCLITSDDAYYTCLGNSDPIKDEPVSENSKSNLEIPSWRVKPYSSWYSMEGTENMSDDVFENRHYRLEQKEQKRKRWDLQRLRELKRVEYLKESRSNRHHSQKSNENNKEELTTLLPSPSNIQAIEITDKLPVSAFGCNLHFKKKDETFKFYHSKWCNDGSQLPIECNKPELRSSGSSQISNT